MQHYCKQPWQEKGEADADGKEEAVPARVTFVVCPKGSRNIAALER